MARNYQMVKRLEKVEQTRRRIAKATYELHSTVGPAHTTIATIAANAGLPRQTIYRNFPSELELLQGCIEYGLEQYPLPDPEAWEAIREPEQRLQTGLGELYSWFEDNEAVMTNSVRDMGAVPVAAQAMAPVFEIFDRMYQVLSSSWPSQARPIIMLAIDFSMWKRFRSEQRMTSAETFQLWRELVRCRSGAP